MYLTIKSSVEVVSKNWDGSKYLNVAFYFILFKGKLIVESK